MFRKQKFDLVRSGTSFSCLRALRALSLAWAILGSGSSGLRLEAGATPVTVTVSPNSSTLVPGASQQFTATVKGTTKTAVTWSCGSNEGWIDGATGAYMAPTATGTYTVRATLNSDITKFGTATVTVAKDVKVALSGKPKYVYAGDVVSLRADATGGANNSLGVSWSTSGGTIINTWSYALNYLTPNDITLEHGRNTGHGKEHLRGNGIDTFHPGYTSYRDAQGNPFILDMNVDDGEGGRFRDALIGDLQIARSGNPQDQATTDARNRLITWVQAARNRIQAIVDATPPNGHQWSRMLYLVKAQNQAGTVYASTISALIQNCIQLRDLLFLGHCSPYTIPGQTQTPSLDLGLIPASFNSFDTQQSTRFRWDTTTTHSHHLHLTFQAPGN